MLPLVTDVDEVTRVRELLWGEVRAAEAAGLEPPETMDLGVMLEVPSLLWQLDRLVAVADFVSVGSNDLAQYVFASDRQNPAMTRRYDPLSAPFLRILRDIAAACSGASVPLSICGEMAGRPLDAVVLAALGYRRLSMAPRAIAGVDRALRQAEVSALRAYLDHLMRPGRCSAASLRPLLTSYLRDATARRTALH